MTTLELIAFQKLKVLIDEAVEDKNNLLPVYQIILHDKFDEAKYLIDAILDNHLKTINHD